MAWTTLGGASGVGCALPPHGAHASRMLLQGAPRLGRAEAGNICESEAC
jgi:hypothetical protein